MSSGSRNPADRTWPIALDWGIPSLPSLGALPMGLLERNEARGANAPDEAPERRTRQTRSGREVPSRRCGVAKEDGRPSGPVVDEKVRLEGREQGYRAPRENCGDHEAARLDADNTGRRDICPDRRILVVATQDSCEVVRRGEDDTGSDFWAHAVKYDGRIGEFRGKRTDEPRDHLVLSRASGHPVISKGARDQGAGGASGAGFGLGAYLL